MTDERDSSGATTAPPPRVEVRHGRRPSIIWIFPLAAAVIAIGLGVRSFMAKGVEIRIEFETAGGLEAGKTKVMYRDVQIGVVESIGVSEGLDSVIVTANIPRAAKRHLTDETRFWVVRPRIGLTGISGLGTLISGAHINVDPGAGAPSDRRDFQGLEVPPVKPADAPGLKIVLNAPKLGSVSVGSPLYFREIRVGQVEAYRLSEDSRSVDIDVFIDEPHHELVKESTRFWNASGISVSMGANGFEVESESLLSLIEGGISFETSEDLLSAKPATSGMRFDLHASREEVVQEEITERLVYLLHFTDSVRGLEVGAPVDLRGIRVGTVSDISLEYDLNAKSVRIPVLIAIEPARIHSAGGAVADVPEMIATLVQHGLRAQLKTGSFITRSLFIDLEFHPETPGELIEGGLYPELPVIPPTVTEMLADVSKIVDTINALPLGQIAGNADKAIRAATRLIEDVDADLDPVLADADRIVKRVDELLQLAEQSLVSVNEIIDEESPINYEVTSLLQELAEAARSVRVLTTYLERHPESILRGKR